MYDRLVKSENEITYHDWIEQNDYSILSPRHRGFYAEMIFQKFCKKNGITTIKINPYFDVLEQIPAYFLKKVQQKELKKMGKICLDFFCFEGQKGYFVGLKMGTSNISKEQKRYIEELQKSAVFLVRVYEDSDILIKRLK